MSPTIAYELNSCHRCHISSISYYIWNIELKLRNSCAHASWDNGVSKASGLAMSTLHWLFNLIGSSKLPSQIKSSFSVWLCGSWLQNKCQIINRASSDALSVAGRLNLKDAKLSGMGKMVKLWANKISAATSTERNTIKSFRFSEYFILQSALSVSVNNC